MKYQPSLPESLNMASLFSIFLRSAVFVLQIPIFLFQFFVDTWLLNAPEARSKPDNIKHHLLEELKGKSDGSLIEVLSPDKKGNIKKADIEKQSRFINEVINAVDIIDIVHLHVNAQGKHVYKCYEYVVQTADGYLLAIHRIINSETRASMSLHAKPPVVYFHHGLLTNSELFVLGDTHSKNLPLLLADRGFDVWLGNNRGNKYSRKHVNLSSSSKEFWDYSLDEFALYDIPNTLDYILQVTKVEKLTYIGFSQGSAQAIAAFALNPRLNNVVNLFVGLSPAMVPKGINNPILSSFINAAPAFLFRLFGERAILPSVVFWQKLMGPLNYEFVVDKSLKFLFNWNHKNISNIQKKIGYPHLFSPTSVKSVVHWFQIITKHRFQMYDEGGYAGSALTALSMHNAHNNHRVAPFPVQTITTPSLLIYGKSDMLMDIEFTKKSLDSCQKIDIIGIDHYEHMDTLWATDVEELVFKPVLDHIMTIKRNELFLNDSKGSPRSESDSETLA